LLELFDLTLGGDDSFLGDVDIARVQTAVGGRQIYLPLLYTFLMRLLLCHPELLKLVADH
jgi:hypothetical protein